MLIYKDGKSKTIKRKILRESTFSKILKVMNSLLELKKDFIGLKDRKLKDRKVRIKE